MDAFYASVEQRDYPELRGRPVAVGGPAESRGVVAAASYEARAFGVRSAIPMARALRLCPELVIVQPDFARYRAVSQQVMAILRSCTPLVEPLSLDEAYLDVTDNLWGEPLASNVAKKLKALIREQLNLSASAGVAPNKFLAKIASGWKKPDGLTVIAPERVEEFLRELPVEALSGVGPVTAKKLRAIGIERLLDVRAAEDERLHRAVGSLAGWLKSLSRGEDPRPVEPDRQRKSLSDENTYEKDLTDLEQIRGEIERIARRTAEGLAKRKLRARTVTIKVRYGDFTTVTRSHTAASPTCDAAEVAARALAPRARTRENGAGQRGIGIPRVFPFRHEPREAERPTVLAGEVVRLIDFQDLARRLVEAHLLAPFVPAERRQQAPRARKRLAPQAVRGGGLVLRVEPAARGLFLFPPVRHESPARVCKLDLRGGGVAPEHDDAHRRRDVVTRLAEGRLPVAAADVPGTLDRGFFGRDVTPAHSGILSRRSAPIIPQCP